jgi:hypothetical protein
MSVATRMVMVSPPMPVTFGSVSPLFVGFMLIMPMVPVSVIMAIPDEFLIRRLAAEMIESGAVLVEMQVGLRFIYHLFVAVIKIKITITGRQFTGKCPMPSVKVNELMVGYVIIRLNVRNIIIFYVVVPGRSP